MSEIHHPPDGVLSPLIKDTRDFSHWNANEYSVRADALADQIEICRSLGLPTDDLLAAYRHASEEAAAHDALAEGLRLWQDNPWLSHPTLADN